MTPQSFLEQARDLDLDIRYVHELLRVAPADTHPRVVAHLEARLAKDEAAWRQMWRSPEMAK